MLTSQPGRSLPARPSLEHLKKEAKARLVLLRAGQADAKLADAQLAVARDYGFPSWRALKAAFDPGADAPDLVGDWIAELVGGYAIGGRFALHVARGAGGLTATVDNPDYGLYGIAAQNLAVGDGRMSFDILHPMRRSRYEGVWDEAAKAWKGRWFIGVPMAADFRRGVFPPDPIVEGLDGVWEGRVGGEKGSPLIITLRTGPHGTHGSSDAPARNLSRYPLRGVERQGDAVILRMVSAVFEGRLGPEGEMSGTLSREGQAWPLMLKRTGPAPAPSPVKPIRLSREELEGFVGTYRFADARELRIVLEPSGLVSQGPEGHRIEMIPVGPAEFAWPLFDGRARFEPSGMMLEEPGRVSVAERVG